ncbi:MAG: hypothetical protein ACP5UO_04360 [Thermoplasmata archaeon]
MLEELYFQMYEIEMLGGEVKRAIHFLEKAAKGRGFYADASKIFLESLKNHKEPEEIEVDIMKLEGDEGEKKAMYLRYLYSYNRYDVDYPKYDSKRCDDR